MNIRIEPIAAFQDNYFWLLSRDQASAVVDPGAAAPVRQRLKQQGLALNSIVVTHHHADHIGGIADLVADWAERGGGGGNGDSDADSDKRGHGSGIRVFGPAGEAIPHRDTALRENDRVAVLGVEFQILDVPGHTRGHIAYYSAALQAVFCGDTLFAGGCGRLFEGTPEQMTASLAKLAQLPGSTRVYCAHEYTLANLRFARMVEPDNEALRKRQVQCEQLRARGEPTVPSTIEEERATNPFLRCDVPAVRAAAERQQPGASSSKVSTFAAIRAWKNRF